MLDIDKNGYLSRNELAVLLRTMKAEPTRDEVDFIFNELDVDKAGSIKKETFIKYMISPVIQTMPLCELESLFVKFDSDGDGAITEDEMIELLRKVNDCRDTKPPHELFLEHDGRITFMEFIKFIQG
ncbi:unnamed protein product [Auanema sp. JU1783]|nr:unnamed protein product [Auanema sp. JU1783]